MIKLGLEGKDKVTGFQGIIIARVEFLFGCNQYGLAPKVTDNGEVKDTQYFDEGRIEIVGNGILPEEVKTEKDGGVSRDVPKRVRGLRC
jgi:hypothetical protein